MTPEEVLKHGFWYEYNPRWQIQMHQFAESGLEMIASCQPKTGVTIF